VITILALLSAALAIYAFAVLNIHFAARYGSPIWPGWGFVVFVVMLIAASALEVLPLPTNRLVMETQNGSAS
jgi:hypothetical protein